MSQIVLPLFWIAFSLLHNCKISTPGQIINISGIDKNHMNLWTKKFISARRPPVETAPQLVDVAPQAAEHNTADSDPPKGTTRKALDADAIWKTFLRLDAMDDEIEAAAALCGLLRMNNQPALTEASLTGEAAVDTASRPVVVVASDAQVTDGATTKHRKKNDDAELDENEKDALDALCDAIFGHEDGTESIDAAALALQFADEPIVENVLTEDLLWRTTMDALAFGHP